MVETSYLVTNLRIRMGQYLLVSITSVAFWGQKVMGMCGTGENFNACGHRPLFFCIKSDF